MNGDATRDVDPIAQLLRGTFTDPDGGAPIAIPIEAIAIERSLRGIEADLVASIGFERRLAVVSDPVTHQVLGARVERALAGTFGVVSIRLDASPHADLATVQRIRSASERADGLVAVGSGTVNDLCRYAAALDRKPYAVFATAASMNGYTSANAAIAIEGHKKTLPAACPRGAFFDLEVIAAAPARLVRAGIGDSVCRPTAQADWLLSHLLLGTPYRTTPFVLLAADEPVWLSAPEPLLRGDLDAMRALVRTLVLSGIGMTICNGSYPASQGEHLVSHFIDMLAPTSRPSYLHGEQVAVATLAMARLQKRMLDGPPPVLHATTESEASLVHRLGPEIGRASWREFAAKALTEDDAATLTARVRERWDTVCAAIEAVSIPAERIAHVLRRAGAPTTPAQIGVTPAFFARAFREARFLRNRYTFLDLAGDAACLDDAP